MSIKKISDLDLLEDVANEDFLPIVDSTNNLTKRVLAKQLLTALVPSNAGAHNSFYRGEDITDLFYDGTLSEQIAAQTFNDIFIGDYIKGKNSGRKYLVADINYYLGNGDTECTTPHVVLVPELVMGTAQMNSTNITTGGYLGSEMYTTNLAPFKTIIQNDFTTDHILTHRKYLSNTVTNGYVSANAWTDSDIELMNEPMVHGSYIFAVGTGYNGSSVTVPARHTLETSQLSLFRLDASKIRCVNDSGTRSSYWLRDVVSSSYFAYVNGYGTAYYYNASNSVGVRPAFLIY